MRYIDLICVAWFVWLTCMVITNSVKPSTNIAVPSLSSTSEEASKLIAMRNKADNTTVKPGDIAYVDQYFFGGRWYETLGLPDAPTSSYVMQYQYTHWYYVLSYYGHGSTRATRSRNKRPFKKKDTSGKFLLLEGYIPEKSYSFLYMVFCWNERLAFDPKSMILVDDALALVPTHASLIDNHRRREKGGVNQCGLYTLFMLLPGFDNNTRATSAASSWKPQATYLKIHTE